MLWRFITEKALLHLAGGTPIDRCVSGLVRTTASKPKECSSEDDQRERNREEGLTLAAAFAIFRLNWGMISTLASSCGAGVALHLLGVI